MSRRHSLNVEAVLEVSEHVVVAPVHERRRFAANGPKHITRHFIVQTLGPSCALARELKRPAILDTMWIWRRFGRRVMQAVGERE